MNMLFNNSLVEGYKNNSQIARILTESWIEENMYCPKCGNIHIAHFKNNRPVADFFCEKCNSEFELKSKKGSLGHKINDGAYSAMISRITAENNPDFIFMSHTDISVTNLLFVPKYFFTPSIIEKRRPLSETARRSGWTGCNILFDKIPEQGRIPIVLDGIAKDPKVTLQLVRKASLLKTRNIESRSWLFDVLNCVNTINHYEFVLDEIYNFENLLKELHPENNNVRAKIRQQLQKLRDKGFIEFLGQGRYRKVEHNEKI